MTEKLERLKKEEAEFLKQYELVQQQAGEARQKFQELEWRLSAEQGDDRRDYEALNAFSENATLEEIGTVLLRRQAREVLIKRIKYAIELAEANFKAAEQLRAKASAPLNQVRAEIQDIRDRERQLIEEKIRLEHKRKMELEIAAFRENLAANSQ